MQNMSGGKTALGLDTNVGAMLCYIPVCAVNLIYSIIVLVTDKTNKLARFHAMQSLLLLAIYVLAAVVLLIFGGVLVGVTQSGALGLLLNLVLFVLIAAFLGVAIFCAVKAFQGQLLKLPVIGDLADKWSN